MQAQDHKYWHDIARVLGSTVGVMDGWRQELEQAVRQCVQRLLSEMDLVTREEFSVVKEMLSKERTQQEVLLERLEALEKELESLRKEQGAS